MTLTLTSQDAFTRYQEVRGRFPALPADHLLRCAPRAVDSLEALTDEYEVFVFDAFGVLNVGEAAIAGACKRIEALKLAGKRVYVLTNAASYSFPMVVEKFDRLGFSFADEELISSRAVCEDLLASYPSDLKWGVIAPKDFQTDELEVDCVSVSSDAFCYKDVDAFLFLSAADWDLSRQAKLIDAMRGNLRPVVVANPDLVAPREVGLTVEPGYFAQDLMDHFPDLAIAFHGKPFASVYDRIELLVGAHIKPNQIVMVGDSLHTDIWGAIVRGWGSVLVTDHGFLRGQDVGASIQRSGLIPDWLVPSI